MNEVEKLEQTLGHKILKSVAESIAERKKRKKKWYRRRNLYIGNFCLSVGLQDGRYEISIGMDRNGTWLFWIELVLIGIEYDHGTKI